MDGVGGDIGGGGVEESCRHERIGGQYYISHYFPIKLTTFKNMQLIQWIE